jgi:hypothetical protein
MKASEIRLSLLEADADGKHVKHVALTITDPELCASVLSAIGHKGAIAKAKDGSHLDIKTKEELAEERQEAKADDDAKAA